MLGSRVSWIITDFTRWVNFGVAVFLVDDYSFKIRTSYFFFFGACELKLIFSLRVIRRAVFTLATVLFYSQRSASQKQ